MSRFNLILGARRSRAVFRSGILVAIALAVAGCQPEAEEPLAPPSVLTPGAAPAASPAAKPPAGAPSPAAAVPSPSPMAKPSPMAQPSPMRQASPMAQPAASPGAAMAGEGNMLGGTAQTNVLVDTTLEQLPSGPLAWVGYEVTLQQDTEPLIHSHDPAVVYAPEGSPAVTTDVQVATIRENEAVFVGRQLQHTHGGLGRYWEVYLTSPGGLPPPEMAEAERIFASPELEELPQPPVQLRFLRVVLPPGSQTSVHTHPGSEFILVTEGEIEYQSGDVGTTTLRAGEGEALPPNTPVQKRNPGDSPAVFLAWFLVDPEQPFTMEASFR